jgi:NADH pyrophosphatase NudC (nudix superfamily)
MKRGYWIATLLTLTERSFMKLKQIFGTNTNRNNNLGVHGLENIKFCSRCGHQYQYREDSGRVRPICPNCGFIYYKNPSPGVSVLIVKGEQVLLCKRAPGNFQSGKWCLPCGFIEFDEDFLVAARREVKEETGLDSVIKSIINVTFNYLSPEIHSLVVVLLAGSIYGNPTPGDDIEAVEWFPINRPLPEMAFAADIMIIEQYKEQNLSEIPVEE